MTELTGVASRNFQSDLDAAISELKEGSRRLQQLSFLQRRELVDACVKETGKTASTWVSLACDAKKIPNDQPIAAEEILAGPATLVRYLQLLSRSFGDFQEFGKPQLPGQPFRNLLGRCCVPILPVRSLFDNIIFRGLKAEVWLDSDSDGQSIFANPLNSVGEKSARVSAVLGAGNVSSIPATDMLYKVFHDNETVILKLNPVNDYLEPVFKNAFGPLIDAQLLRIVCGDGEVGSALVNHRDIDSIHITGSHHTHDAIVWGTDPEERLRRQRDGQPVISKTITSELGNVSPWIVVPGHYSNRQLRSQANHVVASVVNNASFNCLATKMIVTSKAWPQRTEFLDLVSAQLNKVPRRFAYYPGAIERYEKATGRPAPDGSEDTLPWTLIRDADPKPAPHLFEEESFVGVCAETALDEANDNSFLQSAVDFANDELFGTLCASITVTNQFRKQWRAELESAIANLRYGSVCINQWSGVVYGLMTPPWGGHPSTTLKAAQSGLGHVHNTFFLKNFEKTVLWGPLINLPKPVWFHSHRTGNQVGWALLRLYEDPSLSRLLPLLFHALRG